ncbi:unnamed protein product, partial [Rhizoctonia solani]
LCSVLAAALPLSLVDPDDSLSSTTIHITMANLNESNDLPYLTVERWEAASASLMNALNHYTELCIDLGAKALLEGARPENLASRIDSTLAEVHTTMSRQLAESSAALALTRNKLASPISRLPGEIMFKVFMNVVYEHNPTEASGRWGPSMEQDVKLIYRRLYKLIGVCSAWKGIAVNRGTLWSVIPMFAGRSTSEQGPFRLSLQRAGCSKLYLAEYDGSTSASSDLFDVLGEYGPRFYAINLGVAYHHMIGPAIDALLRGYAPGSLSELSIYVDETYDMKSRLPKESDYAFPPNHPQQSSFTSMLGELKAFRTRSVPIYWDALAFSTRLTELRIDCITLGYDDEIVPFLHSLSSAPELRDLKIISLVTFRNPASPPSRNIASSARFPTLKSLFVQDIYLNTLEFLLPTIALGSHSLTLFLSKRCLKIKLLGEDSDDDDDDDEMDGSRGSEDSDRHEIQGRPPVSIDPLCRILEPISIDTLMMSGRWDDLDLERGPMDKSSPILGNRTGLPKTSVPGP